MANCILHIDLDAFFVSAERVLNPELRGKAVIVGGHPDRRGVVASASYEARASGIHAGMPLSTAYRLCPEAIFIQGNFSLYKDTSARFMKILGDFSPYLEPAGLDEAYMDATGFEFLFPVQPQALGTAQPFVGARAKLTSRGTQMGQEAHRPEIVEGVDRGNAELAHECRQRRRQVCKMVEVYDVRLVARQNLAKHGFQLPVVERVGIGPVEPAVPDDLEDLYPLPDLG